MPESSPQAVEAGDKGASVLPSAVSEDDEYQRGRKRNTVLVERAIRNGWKIPDEYRAALVKRQIAIAIDPKTDNRSATRAFAALASAELRERQVLLQEDELQLKTGVAGAIANEIVDGIGTVSRSDLAAGVAALLASRQAGASVASQGIPIRAIVVGSAEGNVESRSVAG